MIVHNHLLLCKTGETGSFLTNFWNNLVRTLTIMSGGVRFPPTVVVYDTDLPLQYKTHNFEVRLYDSSSWIRVSFIYDDKFGNGFEEIINIAVSMASALEYAIDRTECLDIESWKVFYGTTEKISQDVSIDSMAFVLNSTKEYATELFEERVVSRLDQLEKVCF